MNNPKVILNRFFISGYSMMSHNVPFGHVQHAAQFSERGLTHKYQDQSWHWILQTFIAMYNRNSPQPFKVSPPEMWRSSYINKLFIILYGLPVPSSGVLGWCSIASIFVVKSTGKYMYIEGIQPSVLHIIYKIFNVVMILFRKLFIS